MSILISEGKAKSGAALRIRIPRGIFGALLMAGVLSVVASASTPGCPDCPDWNNFNAWWDRYHPPASGPSSESIRDQALKLRSQIEEKPTHDAEYVLPGLIVSSKEDIEGRVLLDARSPGDYQRGHLPGAMNLYWESLRPQGTLDADLATMELCRLGVEETDSIVVYGNGEDSAYLFWALEFLGHENLSRWDGDVEAYSDLKLVENAPVTEESNYTSAARAGLLADESMLKEAWGNPGIQIVDARPSYSDRATSRISNSMYFRTQDLYSDPNVRSLKGAEELQNLFSAKGIDEGKVQVIYGSPEASILYFALRTMGYRAAVIDGDWWQKTEYAVSSIS
ncbi:MAG: Sulfurtransferase [Methanothrix sp.]|jgi:thiosulfate/3-mercaptopyruvate sulfurtransferase|nr:MAG: Sulfurtransferase [Methanothrix sp.]